MFNFITTCSNRKSEASLTFRYLQIAGIPEVIGSPVGLVTTNALALTRLATFRVVGYSQLMRQVLINALTGQVEIAPAPWQGRPPNVGG